MDGVASQSDLAKRRIAEYCQRKGALAVGVADVAALDRISPEGFSPYDVMPRVKSVIAIGVGGPTVGAWRSTAKAMGFMGSSEGLAYKIAYGLASRHVKPTPYERPRSRPVSDLPRRSSVADSARAP